MSLAAGCSLLYEPGDQCDVDSDCVRLARGVPTLNGTFCQNHVCTHPKQSVGECNSNDECMLAVQGDAAICRDARCVRLRSAGCSYVLNKEGLSTKQDVVVLGAFERLETLSSTRRGGFDSFALAASEMQKAGGVVGYDDLRVRRPIVFVVCDNTVSPKLDESFDHLTRNLKVPVIVTTLDSAILVAQLARMSEDPPADAMFVNALSSDSSLDYTDGPRRVWSVLGNPLQDLGPAYVLLTKIQISKVTTSQPRVLMVTTDYVEMLDIANFIESEVRLSGNSAYQYRRVAVDSPSADGVSDTSALTSAINEFAPDVVIALGGEEIRSAAIKGNETRVVADSTLQTGPTYYVLSHHLADSPRLTLDLKDSGTTSGIQKRILGVKFAGARDASLYELYLSRLRAEFPDASAGYENFYDAAYYAMLSVAAVAPQRPTREITGTLAVQGLKRVTDTASGIEHFELGRTPLPGILWALESQERSIAVTGTMGPPEFSLQTGARRTDAAVWCYRRMQSLPQQLEWAGDSIRYDRSKDAFDAEPDSCWQSSE